MPRARPRNTTAGAPAVARRRANNRPQVPFAYKLMLHQWLLSLFNVKRFEDFQETLGISRSLLSERLNRLVEAGVLRREPYKDSVRTRNRYRLTEMGLDLYPVLMALRDWGDRWMRDGPRAQIRHRDCGGEPTLELRCSECGEEVGARDAEARPGPGLRAA